MLARILAALVATLLFMIAIPANAQTIGPTPTDYPLDWLTFTPDGPPLIWTPSPTAGPSPTATATFQFAGQPVNGIVFPSPTRVPSVTPLATMAVVVPHGPVYDFLATAAANINALPDEASAPGGVALLPDEDGQQIFAYAKWMFGASAQELLGPTFAPIAMHVSIALLLVVVLSSVHLAFRVAVAIFKFVAWVIIQIKRIIPFAG